jgi:hypothetical protein
MKEAYVSYEVAKLLKEKGFYLDCEHYYKPNGEIVRTSHTEGSRHINSSVLYEHQCLAPTQQMACRWLREEHKMFISIGVGTDIDDVFGYMPEIYFLEELDSDVGMYGPNVDSETICDFTPQSPEDAIESALKFALTNLI